MPTTARVLLVAAILLHAAPAKPAPGDEADCDQAFEAATTIARARDSGVSKAVMERDSRLYAIQRGRRSYVPDLLDMVEGLYSRRGWAIPPSRAGVIAEALCGLRQGNYRQALGGDQ